MNTGAHKGASAARLWAGIALVAGLAAALPATAKTIDRIAAVVNDEPILVSEVDALCRFALEQIPASLGADAAKQERRKIRLQTLETLIDDKLMDQQVRENNIEVTDDEVNRYIGLLKSENNLTDEQFEMALRQEGMSLDQFREKQRDRIQKQKLLGSEIQSKLRVTETDIAQYYQEHYVQGAGAEKVMASHILFAIPAGTDAPREAAVRERADKVLAALKAGADFAETAKQHSDDPSSSLGGDLGWFRRGDMVAAFEKAAFGLKKGQMSGLVRTRFGYHIILVTDRAADQPPTLDAVSLDVRKRLTKELEQRLVRGWLDDLRRRSYIDIKL
jgi:peptidyl-prolyl cis-trans isomerase SurA